MDQTTCVLFDTVFTEYIGDILYSFSNQGGFLWVGRSMEKWMRNLNL